MYKSPIMQPDEGAVKDVIDLCAHRVIDMLEDEVHKLMQHRGVVLDYDAFKDALKFDRNQYMKGYQDGVEYAEHKPVEAEWEPAGYSEEVYTWEGKCGNCHEFIFYDNYCPNCGAKLIKPDREAWWLPEKKEEPKPEKLKPEGYAECCACRYASWDSKEKDWLCNSSEVQGSVRCKKIE